MVIIAFTVFNYRSVGRRNRKNNAFISMTMST